MEPADLLRSLAGLAREAGDGNLADEAEALAGRLAAGRFFLVCVGQFKRGKSTLLNALVGEPILPTGVVPVTAAVTVLRHGAGRAARIHFTNGSVRPIPIDAIADHVCESRNPGNVKQVAAVEVFLPCPLLENGLCLVDTPGLGSVHAANTETTRAFMPQIDAALLVTGADPPLSGEELELVSDLARDIDVVVCVMNKSDRVSDGDRAEAKRFGESQLAQRTGHRAVRLYQVSAVERIERRGPPRDWPLLMEALGDLVRSGAPQVVSASSARATRRIARRLLADLDRQREALVQPIEETERRVQALSHALDEAELALRDLAHVLQGEGARLASELESRRVQFAGPALREASRRLDEEIAALSEPNAALLRKRALAAADDIAARSITDWLVRTEPETERSYREATARFRVLAQNFLERVPPSLSSEALDPPEPLELESGFRERRRFQFAHHLNLTTARPFTWILDHLRTSPMARGSIRREAQAYLEKLFETNTQRAANDLAERVHGSRRRLESDIRISLRGTVESAERSVARARERRALGRVAVEAALERIAELRRRAHDLEQASSAPLPSGTPA